MLTTQGNDLNIINSLFSLFNLDDPSCFICSQNHKPKLQYKGDGLSVQGSVENAYGNQYQLTQSSKSAGFDMPALLNIGAAYDFYLTKDTSGLLKTHRVTLAGNFTSNSFTKDNFLVGIEYGWKEIVMVRAGMVTEKGLFTDDTRTSALTGPSAGLTVEIPFET